MRPTAIGAPAPEPDDDKQTLEQRIAKLRRAELWDMLRQLRDAIPESPMGPEIPGLHSR